jgi:tRNA-dihydrouridine synthase C
LTIHGRTVADRYQTPVRPTLVKLAVDTLSCPVIANGNVVDRTTALQYHQQTKAAGLMIGRGAIRNPWLFSQISAAFEKTAPFQPSYRDLLAYIHELSEELAKEAPSFDPLGHIQRMKKTLIYICDGIDPEFEHAIRRMKTSDEFHHILKTHLDHPALLPVLPALESRMFCGFSDLL